MEGEIEAEPQLNTKDYLIVVVLTCLALLLLFGAMNQILEFADKQKFILTPCNLCLKENPQLKWCFTLYANANEIPINVTIPHG